ncbi:MAG: MHYT domain-containing protein, partial [Sulfuricellaceae bacterium]
MIARPRWTGYDYWLVGGAFGMGSGIWAMHFIGMLAFHLPVPLAYDFGITALSALFAVLASGLALYLIRHGISGEGELLFSALLMAVGICAMHYTGMAALRMSPPIAYDYGLVALSFLIAYLASLFALWLTFRCEGSGS